MNEFSNTFRAERTRWLINALTQKMCGGPSLRRLGAGPAERERGETTFKLQNSSERFDGEFENENHQHSNFGPGCRTRNARRVYACARVFFSKRKGTFQQENSSSTAREEVLAFHAAVACIASGMTFGRKSNFNKS